MDIHPIDPTGDSAIQFTPINEGMNQVKLDSTVREPTLAEIKVEANEEDEEDEHDTSSTLTPKKRSRKSQNSAPETPTSAKKPRSNPSFGKKPVLGPIPTTIESAGVADRMILRMRDIEGKTWPEITTAYIACVETHVGSSTVRKRYNTMKANFDSVEEEDEPRLLKVKKEVEDKFVQEKWHRIADGIQADGGKKYAVATLQKKFKELSKQNNGATISVKDEA